MTRKTALLCACGAAASLASVASGQTLINVTGATLFQTFFNAPASTNDFIDVDGDGFTNVAPNVDQLAPGGSYPGTPVSGLNGSWWAVHYRATGSVAGLQELINYGSTFVTGGDTGPLAASLANPRQLDRVPFVAPSTGGYNAANPGGCPVRSNTTTLFCTPLLSGGLRVDAAPLDVPTAWGVQYPGVPAAARQPGQGGYGTNPRRAVTPAGVSSGFQNTLANLSPRNLSIGAPDADTIFDTKVAHVPIGIFTNLGTGVSQMKQSELRFFYGTGRRLNGENLVATTRESGSGTRNGCMNSLGIDPSFGVGDSCGGSGSAASGGTGALANQNRAGPNFEPANKLGSGDMESTILNHRLSIGYTGAERGITNNGLLLNNWAELVGVENDLSGGTPGTFVRPVIEALLHNGPNGFLISGTEQFATLGDPRNQSEIGGDTGNTNPRLPNAQAAAYINNITRSIAAIVSNPVGPAANFTPGEFLANGFILVSASDRVHSLLAPTTWIPNPDLNTTIQAFTLTNPSQVYVANDARYRTYGTGGLNGRVPNRQNSPAVTYEDGTPSGGNFYITQGGANLTYGTQLAPQLGANRNRICGDFNGDGLRDLNDATEMLKAYRQRHGGPAWVAPAGTGAIAGAPGTDACIELLGDFDGDGNFTSKDIRYWADGLAIDPATGKLDRKKGFKAIDDAWQVLTGSNNFFGTTIAGGGAYQNGNSAADVVGAPGIAPGWAPVGANGIIDAQDVAYITAQFSGNPAVSDGHADWDSFDEATSFDLSADITGDLIVDQLDLDAINVIVPPASCYANCDGSVTPPILNVLDFSCFLNKFAAGESYANCDHSTTPPLLNVLDFSCFLNQFAAGCP